MGKLVVVAAFLATIPAANWLIGNVGTVCLPNGPCLIPVAPGLMAPSGVLMIGLALVLRDMTHEIAGFRGVFFVVLGGSMLSALVAPPALVVASATAFFLSELADTAVYAPLRRRQLYAAVLLSGLVGAAVDSAVFLWLAFGSLDFLAGNVVGKVWASLFALPVIYARRHCLLGHTVETVPCHPDAEGWGAWCGQCERCGEKFSDSGRAV